MKLISTMIFKLLVLMSIMTQSNAVEAQLKKSDTSVSKDEIDVMKVHIYEKNRFTANSDKDIKNIIYRNKILSNAFLDKYYDKDEKTKTSIMLNEYFAKKIVQKIQAEIGISNDVVRSYYLDHVEDYRYLTTAELDIYMFDSLDEAYKFYDFSTKNSVQDALSYLEENKIKSRPYNGALKFMYGSIRNALRNDKEENYFTPPQYRLNKYVTIFVKKMKNKPGYIELKDVEKNVKKKLWQLTYLKKREEIINEYEQK